MRPSPFRSVALDMRVGSEAGRRFSNARETKRNASQGLLKLIPESPPLKIRSECCSKKMENHSEIVETIP
jgi:hypothetical protein